MRSRPPPGAYNQTVNGVDEKTWKVLNSKNLRNNVKVVVSHRKLLQAGFLRNNRAIYNNSEEPRFKKVKPVGDSPTKVGPGKYDVEKHDWIKRTFNSKYSGL